MGSFQQQLLSAMTARLQVSMCNLNVLFMLCGIFFIPEIQLLHIGTSKIYTGWVKKKYDLKKFKIALSHSILKLKSFVIPLNQMSRSGEKHAQD